MTSPRVAVALPMLGATIAFALMGAAVKAAAAHHSVGEILFYRGLVATVLLGLATRFAGVPLLSPAWRLQAAHLSALALSLGAYFAALAHLPLTTAITLNYMSTLWLALGTAALGYRATKAVRLIDVGVALLGYAGVLLVLRPAWSAQTAPYAILGLLSGVAAAGAYSLAGKLGALKEPIARTVWYSSLGSLAIGTLLASVQGWHHLSINGSLLLLAVALLALAGQWLLTKAFGGGDPLLAGSLQYLGVVHAAILGGVLFSAWPTGPAMLGSGLIVGAALLCVWSRERRLTNTQKAKA